MPQSMQRDACRAMVSAGKEVLMSLKSLMRSATGRYGATSRPCFRNPLGSPMLPKKRYHYIIVIVKECWRRKKESHHLDVRYREMPLHDLLEKIELRVLPADDHALGLRVPAADGDDAVVLLHADDLRGMREAADEVAELAVELHELDHLPDVGGVLPYGAAPLALVDDEERVLGKVVLQAGAGDLLEEHDALQRLRVEAAAGHLHPMP